MSVKSVNLRGYKTKAARARRAKREGGPAGLVEAMRFVGMNDAEIKAQMEAVKAEQVRDRELRAFFARCTFGAHHAMMERADCAPEEFMALARRASALAGQGEILRTHVEQAAAELRWVKEMTVTLL